MTSGCSVLIHGINSFGTSLVSPRPGDFTVMTMASGFVIGRLAFDGGGLMPVLLLLTSGGEAGVSSGANLDNSPALRMGSGAGSNRRGAGPIIRR